MKSAISTHVLNFGHFDLPVLRSPQGEGWVSDLGLELRISLLLPNSLPNKMIRSKPILVRLRRNPCVLGPVSCPFDLCRESSTNRPLFVQTNPTSKTAKINATLFSTKAYDKTTLFEPTENEPKRTQTNPKRTQFFARQGPSKPKRTQTNPKQTQFPKNPKSNATSFYTKRYDNMPDFASPKTNPNEPNQSQFPKNPKIYATSVLTKDYENETTFSLRQNKPKRTQSPYAQQNEHNFHSHKGLCQ